MGRRGGAGWLLLCAIFLVGILGGAISSVINEEKEKKRKNTM